jgi:hypothetical protein
MDGKPVRRIVEGAMFGTPLPGRWPGGEEPWTRKSPPSPRLTPIHADAGAASWS